MLLLVLDDNKGRHLRFDDVLGAKHQIVHANNSAECMKALQEDGPFDVVYLDHDLGEKTPSMYGYDEVTGNTVAKWMCEVLPREKLPKEIIIHSWNVNGAWNMMATFIDHRIKAEYAPFRAASGDDHGCVEAWHYLLRQRPLPVPRT